MLASLAVPAGANWQTLYTAGGTIETVVEANMVNTTAADIQVGLIVTRNGYTPLSGSANPATADCAVYEIARVIGASGVKGNGPLTRSLVLQPGCVVMVRATAAGVAASVQGTPG